MSSTDACAETLRDWLTGWMSAADDDWAIALDTAQATLSHDERTVLPGLTVVTEAAQNRR
jgi:hypothetical protein